FFPTTIKPERFARLETFLFRSEDDCSCVTQDAIVSPGPIEPFFEMLERKRFLKPGVEHAVRKHVVRNGRTGVTSPGSEAQVLPDSVHDHAIIIAAMLAKPGPERARVAVTG